MKIQKIKIFCVALSITAFISISSEAFENRQLEIPDPILDAAPEKLNDFILLGSALENKRDEAVYKLIGVAGDNIYKKK